MQNRIPRPGEFYRHFKNKLYQVIAVAEHTETGEAMVVYQALYGDFRVYVRPLEMFVSEVDRDKYPGAVQRYRFELTDPSKHQDGEEKKQEERRSRLDTWRESREEAEEENSTDWEKIEEEISDLGEYEDAEKTVIPREGRAEKDEDDLWASLTDEAVRAAGDQDSENENVNPRFLDFLEARTYESKAAILEAMKDDLDDAMIDGLALAIDVEIPEGPLEQRYHQLLQCLETMARYEDRRLR